MSFNASQNGNNRPTAKRRIFEMKANIEKGSQVLEKESVKNSQPAISINLRKIHELLLRSSQYHNVAQSPPQENLKANVRLNR
jgi:hypothetical protein